MILLKVFDENPQLRAIQKAAEILNNDGLIIYPTDTIYGLGCSLYSKKGLEKLYKIKNMNAKTPLSFIASDLSNVSNFAQVDNQNYRLLNKYLPGPYTFILPANRKINKYMLYDRKEVGIRVPKNNICRVLTEELGCPVITTSVPLWGEEILNNGEKIANHFSREIDLVLDSGTIISEPSTIIDLTKHPFEIIRQGRGLI